MFSPSKLKSFFAIFTIMLITRCIRITLAARMHITASYFSTGESVVVSVVKPSSSPASGIDPTSSRSIGTAVARTIRQEKKEDAAWAASPNARQVLASGVSKRASQTPLRARTMDEFITLRGFVGADRTSPSPLLAHGTTTVPAVTDAGPAHRTLSAALTFPLTLAYGLNAVTAASAHAARPPRAQAGAAIGGPEVLNVLVVGARAEASLPLLWWNEALSSLQPRGSPPSSSATAAASAAAASTSLTLHMMGPSLPPPRALRSSAPAAAAAGTGTDTGSDSGSGSGRGRSEAGVHVVNVPGGNKLLHDHPDAQSLLEKADLVLLCHPGMGHRGLRSDWLPTVQLLAATGTPVLCTAHSTRDLQRDIAVLHELPSAVDILLPSLVGNAGEGWGPIESIMHSVRTSPPSSSSAAAAAIPTDAADDADDVAIDGLFSNPFRSSRRTWDPHEEPGAHVVTTNAFVYAFKGAASAGKNEKE